MSRYDLFRRRLVPIAFFIVLGLIIKDSCAKGHRTHTTFELELGAAAAQIRAVDVEVMLGDETFATFHRSALPESTIGPCRWPVALPQDDGELRIDVDLGTSHKFVTRRFHVVEGGTTLVPLTP